MGLSRFASPVSGFNLDEIVSRLRTTFLISVALAAIIHLAIVAINPFQEAKTRAPRPMVTRFVKREPRLTKPLELRKIPQPKLLMARREVRLARARMDQVQATASFNARSLIASNVRGSGIELTIGAGVPALSTSVLEPRLVSPEVTSTRTSENRVDMALEMLDVNSMDTGRYKAMVIQDAGDRQAITGFVKFAQVVSSTTTGIAKGNPRFGGRAIDRLCDSVNEYTGVRADFLGLITFDDPRLLEIPIIIPQGAPNEAELANLAEYLLAGGFVFGDRKPGDLTNEVIRPIHGWDEALEKYGGLMNGKDFWSERLPEDHPIFTAYFDIGGGPPLGHPSGSGKENREWWNYVTGHYVKGRLAGITPNGSAWGWQNDLIGFAGTSVTRRLHLAVNIIIYALTQEGSITQRLMQMVN